MGVGGMMFQPLNRLSARFEGRNQVLDLVGLRSLARQATVDGLQSNGHRGPAPRPILRPIIAQGLRRVAERLEPAPARTSDRLEPAAAPRSR